MENYGKVPDFRYLPQPLRWKLSMAYNNYILKQRNMPLMTLSYEQSKDNEEERKRIQKERGVKVSTFRNPNGTFEHMTFKERVEQIKKRLKRDKHKS